VLQKMVEKKYIKPCNTKMLANAYSWGIFTLSLEFNHAKHGNRDVRDIVRQMMELVQLIFINIRLDEEELK